MTSRQPTERQEQMALARKLDSLELVWCHVPNEGARDPRTGYILKKCGMKAGFPDVLIFSQPPNDPKAKGVAIELKTRAKGRASPAQLWWMEALANEGWLVYLARGYRECLNILLDLGYIQESEYDLKRQKPLAAEPPA